MSSDEVIVQAPPPDVHQQRMFGLGQGSGLAPQGSHGLVDGQVEPVPESSLDESEEADRFEFLGQGLALIPLHASDGIGLPLAKDKNINLMERRWAIEFWHNFTWIRS
jgi:hypothetical protein